jgi:hypothetical protein
MPEIRFLVAISVTSTPTMSNQYAQFQAASAAADLVSGEDLVGSAASYFLALCWRPGAEAGEVWW